MLNERSPIRFEMACELTETLWVMALPGEKVTKESLVSTGLPDDAALMISERGLIRPEWCTIKELDPSERPDERAGSGSALFRKTCIDTVLVIPKATAVRSDRIVLTAERADAGTLRLVRLSVQ